MDWRDVRRVVNPRREIDADVREELTFHLEERVRELVARGLNEEEARAEVLERFGDVEAVEAECRDLDAQRVDDERRRDSMEAIIREFGLAVRSLRRAPSFTLTVCVTLALGIGVTTAVFGVLEAVVLRPLPFPEPERLAIVWQNDRATGTVREAASTSDYYDYVERSRTFEALGIFSSGTAVLTRDGAPALQLDVTRVSRNVPNILGIEPRLGRGFTPAEDRPEGPHAALLTDRVWRDLFGADPSVVGSTVEIEGRSTEIAGVLPAGIDFPAADTDVWLPIQQDLSVATRPQHWVRVLGRLRDGFDLEAAQAEMSSIMADLELEYANDNQNRGAFVEALSDVGRVEARTTLWVLFAAVLAVLAIACVNVMNLLLARGSGRMKELAVLTAIGAGAGDVHRRFFVEAFLLTGVASVGGVALAMVGNRMLFGLAPADVQALGQPEVNLPVLLFALSVCAAICAAFGLLPSVQARGLNLPSELKDGRTTGVRGTALGMRRMLVAAQLALAVTLLLGATLLIGTVRNLQGVDPGFDPEQTLRLDFMLPAGTFPATFAEYPNWPGVQGALAELEDQVTSVPGVESVAVTLNHPLDPGFTNSFRIEGRAYDPTQGEMTARLVTPAYFQAAGTRMLEGRSLESGDRLGSTDVIVLNREAAERYFPGGDAIGSRIAFWGPTYREVVGIVENEKVHGLTREAPPAMYVSMYQAPPRGGKLTLMVRAEVPPLGLVDPVRSAVRTVDPDIPVFNVATMEETLAEAMGRERFATTVLILFSGVAVFLAVLGVHGVLAYLVAQRGHEVGVRMALGASRGDVVRMVVGQGLAMAAAGIVVGCLAFLAASGILQSLLFGVNPMAPGMFLGVGAGLAAAAALGAALPAVRAASIDPVRSLRAE